MKMNPSDRRTFLKQIGTPALAAALPLDFSRVLAIPANDRTRSITDVEHIVFLMQENRSFDHYFGTMRGVRGFADPRVMKLANGAPVWNQPNGNGVLLPFRPDVADLGQTFLPDPPHGWTDTHAAWNGGRYDRWVPNKGVTTMTFHTRADLPYQFALADAFTICDNYHCSIMGPTDPNRYHMWTGWVGNDGKAGGPEITNSELGYDWSTYPERLERAGISWKVYQDIGLGLTAAQFWGFTDDPYIGNFGDNSLLYFHKYQNAPDGSPLAAKARIGTNINALNRDPNRLMDLFRADVERGRLPQVSWIVAPEAYCEHPNWEPDFGAWYVSQVVDILASNPDVFARTALFVTYDEEGGFFDHLVPPTPPQTPPADGRSTVATTNEIFGGDPVHPTGPYGLGIRVPMIVISPWSRGGWINSQLFDHTSLIRFLEARFGEGRPDLIESNITPWRRAVAGDLTTAFDFRNPNGVRRVVLPSTDAFKPEILVRHPDEVPVPPAHGELPPQETGVKAARALPYALEARGRVQPADSTVWIKFENTGAATAVFQVRSGNPADAPRNYTVEPGKSLTDVWHAAADGSYDLSVFAPNGFFREFRGRIAGAHTPNVEVMTSFENHGDQITLTIANRGNDEIALRIFDRYAGHTTSLALRAGETDAKHWPLARTRGWFDLALTIEGDARFLYQLAGHFENGEDSISDPLMGGLVG
ncbi:MAG TPA: phospholipase C, phosphocholine-specific [Vicinamibacterales bacterium]|nr:phospholipase C, phosphocholine-specific [Vicinamibacterales bacterium]